MPKLNQTGPQGEGPRTGRGLGRCNNNKIKVDENFPSFGRAQGQNKGQGQGLGRNRKNTPLREQEREVTSK